jgi:hypothetical protein
MVKNGLLMKHVVIDLEKQNRWPIVNDYQAKIRIQKSGFKNLLTKRLKWKLSTHSNP